MSRIQQMFGQIKARLMGKPKEKAPGIPISEALQNQNLQTNLAPIKAQTVQRPHLEKYYVYVLILLCAYVTADLTVLYFRDKMIPTSAPPGRATLPPRINNPLLVEYDVITKRNIFNSDGLIPPALSAPQDGGKPDVDAPARLSSLPLKLEGTIVHRNPGKSLATVEVKGKILPFIPNDDIEGLATLLKVERKRIIFRNNSNGLNEYIEMKEDKSLNFGLRKEPTSSLAPSPEQKDFAFNRNEVNSMIRNLPELLQQARAEPRVLPGGKIDGFCMVDIMPGSIYEKIGLRVGDCIKGVNGESVDSPAKAMEMYQQLRTANRISIEIDRNGSKETLSYTIN